MATIYLSLSSKVNKDTQMSEVLMRLVQGSKINRRAKTGIFVTSEHFKYADGKDYGEIVVKNRLQSADKIHHDKAKSDLSKLIDYITKEFQSADWSNLPKDWLQEKIDRYNHPERFITKEEKPQTFFELFEEFITKSEKSPSRTAGMRVLQRALQRYEMFRQKTEDSKFCLDINTLDGETIEDFVSFLRNEYTLYEEFPSIFKAFPPSTDKRRSLAPLPRGNNALVTEVKRLRVFVNWCIKYDKTTNHPFKDYQGVSEEKYGTPWYLTLEERNFIADFDLSERPTLEVQRDIFIFQCLVGCRVSDLMKFTRNDIIDDELTYVPRKTKDNHPVSVKVPLNGRAKALVQKYDRIDKKGRLFPFISSQRYNDAIKEILTICEINRLVPIMNPQTGEEEKKPLNEIASSHMARRTFIGNLYKKVQDPNLICPLSGHKEGSKSFARYREIDKDIRRKVVSLID